MFPNFYRTINNYYNYIYTHTLIHFLMREKKYFFPRRLGKLSDSFNHTIRTKLPTLALSYINKLLSV